MKNPIILIPYLILSFFLIPQKKIFGQIDETLYSNLEWNFVGPTRGGRSTTVAGIASQPYTFLMGTTGGGVWKTTDAGLNWENVSDGEITVGSIGALAIAPNDPNIMFAGTGSADPRGNSRLGRISWRTPSPADRLGGGLYLASN